MSRSNLSFAFPARLESRRLPRRPKCGLLAMTLEERIVSRVPEIATSPKIRAPRNDSWGDVRTLGIVIASPRSFPLSRHYEGHGSGLWQSPRADSHAPSEPSLRGSFCEPKQSLFCVSQYTLDTRDCRVGAKDAPPRNDVVVEWPLGCGDCHVGTKTVPGRNDDWGLTLI